MSGAIIAPLAADCTFDDGACKPLAAPYSLKFYQVQLQGLDSLASAFRPLAAFL